MKTIKTTALTIAALAAMFVLMICFMPQPQGFPILEYHTVTDTPEEGSELYNVPPEDFAAQLDYLKKNGYTTITTLEFMKAKRGKFTLPDKPIILSFDDGYEDNYTNMLPILEAHGMKAVVYVITNEVGKPGYLNLNQIREMQERGIEIGSHTANHRPLSGLSHDEMTYEVRMSKRFIEWSGLNTIFSLSYPNGAYSDELVEILKKENYLTAVTGDAGLNDFDTNPYLMQRVNIPKPRFGILEFRLRLLKSELAARLHILQHKLTKEE